MRFRSQRGYTGSGIDSAPLNWRRGLFRLWLLVSAAWMMGWAIYVILSALAHAFKTVGDYFAIPVIFFGPPIALLICGLAAKWAIGGFMSDEKREERPHDRSTTESFTWVGAIRMIT